MQNYFSRDDYRALRGSRYLVFGAARSGVAAVELLRALGREARVRDEAPAEQFAEARRRFDELSVPAWFGPASPADLDGVDAIILSPGVPAAHALIQQARRRSIPVYSELELGFACSPAAIVAITGSNGKTTTTTLVAHFLRAAGAPTLEAGNIGHPLCAAVLTEEARKPGAVLSIEVSSFQLEAIDQFRPVAAIVLNITPDHLDRYGGSIDAYAAAKARITLNQTESDALIVNQDDARCLALLQETRAQPWTFSTFRPVERGAYLSEDMLMVGAGREHALCSINEVPLPGMHNVSNVLAAAAAACFLKLPIKAVRQAVLSVQPARHRLQFVAEVDGVAYYNDSKATNVDAVLKALQSFSEPIILLAGGRDKGSPFERYAGEVCRRVKKLIVFGEAAPLIRRAWGRAPTVEVPGMAEAVPEAARSAAPGDVVLLSPACASFDQYRNYEERGDDFIARVNALRKES
ncbi:MAG: UDP-N-acetylmuramoyl-L-alanine--D-glutamate ligase [Candidatus Sumerlaeota bacterium]|nr:UDP-N-acetylmuramoyl-L-alanine--D-glutamate ligase [Candidatus Sumerlaeota bacterium]